MVNKVGGRSFNLFAGDISQGNLLGMQKKKDSGLFGRSPETTSLIDAKRQEIRKKIMTVMGDQFKSDQVSTDAINDGYKRLEGYKEVIGEMNGEIRKINEAQAALQEELEITEDSQEHQDLELMRKNRDKPYSLTFEERERAKQLESQPKTYYQELSLANDELRNYYNAFKEEAQEGIMATNAEISGTKEGLLKQHGMADAQDQMAAIEKAGADEIIGMLKEAAMEHIQEEMEEQVEDAKKAAEEKKEQEEKIEEAKAESAEQGEQAVEIMDNAIQADKDMDEVQEELSKILKEAELLPEDQKGLLIDKQL